MTTRKGTVQIFKLGEEPKERDYWLTRPMEERVMEVFRLRAMWGADKEPMQRVVTGIRPLKKSRTRGTYNKFMTEPAFRKMTEEEYLRFLTESEVRYEYVDGFVYAQAGATNAHNLIAGNIYSLLRPAAKSKGCYTYQNDMRLRLMPPHSGKPVHYFPDVMVSCEGLSNDAMSVTQPCLVVEVLSQSTRAADKSYKAERYRELPSLQVYLMVDSLSRSAALYRRMGDEWAYEIVDETVELPCPEVTLTLTDIYDGVKL